MVDRALRLVASIELDDEEYSLNVGQTHVAKVYVEYSDRTRKEVTSGAAFRSLNPTAIKADANGIVTALKSGKADVFVEDEERLARARVNVIK